MLILVHLSSGTFETNNSSNSSESSRDQILSRSDSGKYKEMGSSKQLTYLKPEETLIHKEWPANSNRRSSFEPGWFGFNNFITRSARHLPLGFDRTSLLGESTHVYPMINIPPPFPNFNMNPNLALQQHLNEMQHSFSIKPPNDGLLESQLVVIEQPMQMPPGFLVPVYRPPQNSFKANQPTRNYQQPKVNLHQSSSAPNPVTIKIVPLKITSFDIGNVLKSMSWVPIPMDLLKVSNAQKMNGNNDGRSYDSNKPMFDDDEESDLPPPSSHVATPLGITYADSIRSQRYTNRYNNRYNNRS
ncbi:uncharacterized protein [Parasteatoda tepidariorum]|uniref:uncharacterized protein n=1 Tax=Parasteatoda tepidariorum TaxID=114398 RepID=UPI0039BCB3A4